MTQLQKVKFGKHRQRRSYARISEVIDLPDLIEIQTLSYDKFLETGLKDVFKADIFQDVTILNKYYC